MAKSARKTRKKTAGKNTARPTTKSATADASQEAIKAAEQVALSAFASGLKLAAAFGTVAAKTASLALSSLATGADRFSELVKKEALASSGKTSAMGIDSPQTRSKRRKPYTRRSLENRVST